jgi:predicted alpha/beta superfamily hydrolase
MVAFEVTEADLRPNGAEDTYQYLEKVLLPYIKANMHPIRLILGGYSLGGLFALWSVTRTDAFDAVYAGSPSLWMEGWNEYADTHPLKVEYAYMSLGDKEECTRKQPFCIIGNRVRLQHKRHEAQLGSDHCILEWNEGGHFNEIEMRKAKGAAWCLLNEK